MTWLICLGIVVKRYSVIMLVLSLPLMIIQNTAIVTIFIEAIAIGNFMLVIAYYEHLRINKINKTIEDIYRKQDPYEVDAAVKKFVEEHNRYCDHIVAVNQFWKNVLLAFMATAFPINLTVMHQLLFENLSLNLRLLYAIGMIFDDVLLFGLQYCFASLSVKIHKMHSKLSRLQWSLNGYPFQLRTKLKLLMCFERLSSKKKIGITMGSIVFTMTLFRKVSSILLINSMLSIN